jgi:hypothetical protein
VVTVLDLEPHRGSACPVGAVGPFAYDPFQAQPASGLEYLRAVTFEVFHELQALILAPKKCLQPALTFNEREGHAGTLVGFPESGQSDGFPVAIPFGDLSSSGSNPQLISIDPWIAQLPAAKNLSAGAPPIWPHAPRSPCSACDVPRSGAGSR